MNWQCGLGNLTERASKILETGLWSDGNRQFVLIDLSSAWRHQFLRQCFMEQWPTKKIGQFKFQMLLHKI